MKNFLLATSTLFAIAGAQPASAADATPAPRLPTKTPIVPAAIYDWTGCYIGAHGGGSAVSDTLVGGGGLGSPNFLHSGGGFAGGQIGCNVQDGVMVLGFEGEAWSAVSNVSHFNESGFTETPSTAIAGAPTRRSAPASPSTARSFTARRASPRAASPSRSRKPGPALTAPAH